MAASSRPPEWRTARQVEDYVGVVADLMQPAVVFGDYGSKAELNEFPIERPALLGALLSPLRRRSALEEWSPREIATFEGALALHGKAFHTVQRFVRTKTVKECIEFYYLWKMSSHYSEWKRHFEPAISEY
ncbi:hypothetical protein M885DRAFT_515590 [Pelagophyceae sp. CCMP2097]|nr:hypothetical protein M885DRAFT_515590 [Pelagophyceae sp. CCMP2097]